jgi:hypothetical protein
LNIKLAIKVVIRKPNACVTFFTTTQTIRDKGTCGGWACVIKGGEIGYQLRFGFAKTILLLHVSTPTNKYKRDLSKMYRCPKCTDTNFRRKDHEKNYFNFDF